MDKEQLAKFWQDFKIPTQEDDTNFPYANPSDAARSLIKSRNWVGVITEEILSVSEVLTNYKKELNTLLNAKENLDKWTLALAIQQGKAISNITKNKEVQKAFILSIQSGEELKSYRKLEEDQHRIESIIFDLENHIDYLNVLLKTVDKTTDWIIQYVNWMKIEVRASI